MHKKHNVYLTWVDAQMYNTGNKVQQVCCTLNGKYKNCIKNREFYPLY